MINTEIRQKIFKKTLGLTLVFSAAAFAFAQSQQQKVAISGTVTDTSNSAVPYGSIAFQNKTNPTLSDATLTDEKGDYTLSLAPGVYTVTVDVPGYQKKITEKTITAAGNIGTIIVQWAATSQKTTTIQGVTIDAANSKPYKVDLDKKVYNPANDLASIGGNLQDVLSNVPSVDVDTDGTVSIRGNSNVKFLINGKPSSLLGIDDGPDALKAIPAEEIDRIEVITNPSSKFEASGTAGILNIILKKTKKAGFSGSVMGSLGYLPKGNFNTNLNWRKGNWTWFVNGGVGYNKSKMTSTNDMTMKTDIATLPSTAFPFTQISNQDGHTNSHGSNYNLSAGMTHDFNAKSSMNFSAMIRNFNSHNNTLNLYHEKDYLDPTNFNLVDRSRSNPGDNKALASQFDLGYDHKFDDKGQNISLSGSFQTSRNNGDSDIIQQSFINQILQSTGNSTNEIRTHSTTKRFIGTADYELPIGDNSKFDAGARYDWDTNRYDYFVNQSDDGGPTFTRFDFTSNTKYTEGIFGIYAQFRSKIGEDLSYQVGLRSETSGINIDFDNFDANGNPSNTKVKKNYTKLFPTVFLGYNLDSHNQLLLNYSRRIQRPRAFSLIPFFSFSDDKNLFRGNPDLNPSYENSYEFGYNLTTKKVSFNPTLYYKKEVDSQNRYQYVDDNGAVNSIPVNAGTQSTYGLDMSGTYNPLKWWKMMLSVNVFGYKNTGSYNMFPNNPQTLYSFAGNGSSFRLRFNNTFNPTKNLALQLQSFYRGGQKTAMTDRRPMYGMDFGATQNIWKGKGTIAFNVRDIFNTRRFRMTSDTPQFVRVSEMQWQPRQVSISLTYRFSKGLKVDNKKKKQDINSDYQDDSGNDQGGMGGPSAKRS